MVAYRINNRNYLVSKVFYLYLGEDLRVSAACEYVIWANIRNMI